jgi:hypothetical protein
MSKEMKSMTDRSHALTFCLVLLGLLAGGAAIAQPAGDVDIRFLDQPIEDLKSYSENVLSTSSRTAPVNSLGQRSAATTDVLLLPYFETDTKNPNGVNTLFALRNETGITIPVRILYLGVLGAVENASEEIEIAPHATRTINLRDVDGLPADEDGIARGLVVLGAIGHDGSSDVLSGDFFFVDPATDYATGNTLLNMSFDDTGNEFCSEWGSRFFRGGAFSGISSFRVVVDVAGGAQSYDPPTAVGTVYDEAGSAIRSFEIRTNLSSFQLSSSDIAPEGTAFGSLSIRFPDTKGVVLVEHSGFHRLSVALKGACRDSVTE